MPLLVRPTPAAPPVVGVPPQPPERLVDVRWVAPDGTVLPMMSDGEGVHVLAGGEGFGAAPRILATRSLSRGGVVARWSHADARIITLPIHLQAETQGAFVELRRTLARAFLQTTPPAGVPQTGTMRVRRADGTSREVNAVYMDGLGWGDDSTAGPNIDRSVLQLLCPDPWWYGASQVALEFGINAGSSYFVPYETVSPDRTVGSTVVNIVGDVAAMPVWVVTGPAESVTVRYEPAGPGWTYGAIPAGVSVTIDTANNTVTDSTGANRIGNLAWGTSRLFSMHPGPNDLVMSLRGGINGQSSIRMTYRPRYETA